MRKPRRRGVHAGLLRFLMGGTYDGGGKTPPFACFNTNGESTGVNYEGARFGGRPFLRKRVADASIAAVLSEDEARRIAANIAKLPLLSRKIRLTARLRPGWRASIASFYVGVDVILDSDADSMIHIATTH